MEEVKVRIPRWLSKDEYDGLNTGEKFVMELLTNETISKEVAIKLLWLGEIDC